MSYVAKSFIFIKSDSIFFVWFTKLMKPFCFWVLLVIILLILYDYEYNNYYLRRLVSCYMLYKQIMFRLKWYVHTDCCNYCLYHEYYYQRKKIKGIS